MDGTTFKDLSPRRARDRREGPPPAPLFGELLLDCGWEPEGLPAAAHEGWLRSRGQAPERRGCDRRW